MEQNTAKSFFSESQQTSIVATIKEVERNTSSEVRLHIDTHTKLKALDRAAYLFKQLNMHKTKARNGVLLYMSIQNKSFAVIGDAGIHHFVKDAFWNTCRDEVVTAFRKGNFCDGIIDCIKKVGVELQQYFPYQADDKNELPDELSFD